MLVRAERVLGSGVAGFDSVAASFAALGLSPGAAMALCERHGLTRFSEQTGLDTLNVPVWSCIRPRARSTAASYGKGLSAPAAQISAFMEAMECSYAEDREALVRLNASLDDMARSGRNIVNLKQITRCEVETLNAHSKLDWVEGVQISSNRPIYAPFNLVGLDYQDTNNGLDSGFDMSTVGLAAGRTWEEAAAHGLLELIENDIVAVIGELPNLLGLLPRGHYQPGYCPQLDEALRIFEEAGVTPVFTLLTEQFSLPVVMCSIPRFADTDAANGKTCVGFACRGSIADAALAALLESAQTRLALIAGAREDLQDAHYQEAPGSGPGDGSGVGVAPFFQVQAGERAGKPPFREIVSHLNAGGIRDVSVFSLSSPEDPICVVRVLAEQLLGSRHRRQMDLGPRFINVLLGATLGKAGGTA